MCAVGVTYAGNMGGRALLFLMCLFAMNIGNLVSMLRREGEEGWPRKLI